MHTGYCTAAVHADIQSGGQMHSGNKPVCVQDHPEDNIYEQDCLHEYHKLSNIRDECSIIYTGTVAYVSKINYVSNII